MTNRIVLNSLLSLFVLASAGKAQEDRAVVTGIVTDPSQAAIRGAIVRIDNKATGFHREVLTNDSGAYLIPGLLIGVYELHIGKDGFRAGTYNALELAVGQTRTINTELQIATSSQEVMVVAEMAALEESSSKVAGVISATQVSELPINGRAWTDRKSVV